MDWFSWLSKTKLDPCLVHNYAIVFSHNELEEDDISYFNHEFLLSMGISVAKHRLEILKLATKEKQRKITKLRPIIWFLIAMKQTKKYLANRIRHNHDSALSIVPAQRSYSSRWKAAAMLKSSKKFMAAKQGSSKPMLTYGSSSIIGYNDDITQPVDSGQTILMLTNGSPTMESPYLAYSFSSPNFPELTRNDGEDLANTIESMRWESMFQDLKPT